MPRTAHCPLPQQASRGRWLRAWEGGTYAQSGTVSRGQGCLLTRRDACHHGLQPPGSEPEVRGRRGGVCGHSVEKLLKLMEGAWRYFMSPRSPNSRQELKGARPCGVPPETATTKGASWGQRGQQCRVAGLWLQADDKDKGVEMNLLPPRSLTP